MVTLQKVFTPAAANTGKHVMLIIIIIKKKKSPTLSSSSLIAHLVNTVFIVIAQRSPLTLMLSLSLSLVA